VRALQVFRAAVAALVIGPLLVVGSAYADPAPDDAGVDQPYQDVQLPAEPGDQPSDMASPLPFSDGENRMVVDFLAKKLTAEQFVALGISASVGGPLPAKYQDRRGGDHDVDGSGDGHDGNGVGRGDGDGEGGGEHGGAPAGSGHALTPPAPVDASAGAPSGAADGSGVSDNSAVVSGDSGTSTQFLNYVFGVAASDDSAANLLASMFEPTPSAAGDQQQTDPTAHSALTLQAAALPYDPQCASPATIKLSPILDILTEVVPTPVLRVRLPATTVFPCVASTAHFRVYYSLASKDKTNGVADQARAGNGVPVYINHVTSALENAYGYYSRLGYKQPPGQVTVLISSFWGAMNNGAAFTPPPVASHQFIVMDNHNSELYLPTHELFHTFQYRYIAVAKYLTPGRFEAMNWWMEATAEWAAHRAMASTSMSFTDLQGHNERTDYDGKLPVFLGTPGRRLNDWTGLGGQARQYGAFIFAEFLADDFGTTAILHTWQHIGNENGHLGSDYLGGGTYPIKAVKETLAGYGTNYDQQLPIFAKAAYQLGPDEACAIPTIAVAPQSTPPPAAPASPALACYWGYPSYQFQFNDPDLDAWITQLGNDSRTRTGAGDPAPGDPRPNHRVVTLNSAGASGTQRTNVEAGGMAYADLTWSGYPYEDLAVTVNAPKGSHLHASVISWNSYRERCGYDQDADIPAGKSITLQTAPIDGCAFATLVITDTAPTDSQSAPKITTATWSTRFVNPPIYT
jgi:hypothetical protein